MDCTYNYSCSQKLDVTRSNVYIYCIREKNICQRTLKKGIDRRYCSSIMHYFRDRELGFQNMLTRNVVWYHRYSINSKAIIAFLIFYIQNVPKFAKIIQTTITRKFSKN